MCKVSFNILNSFQVFSLPFNKSDITLKQQIKAIHLITTDDGLCDRKAFWKVFFFPYILLYLQLIVFKFHVFH